MTYGRISEIFVEKSNDQILELEEAIAKNNLLEVASLSHKLKGSVGQFTMSTPYLVIRNLEEAAKANNTMTVQSHFEELKIQLRELKASFFWLSQKVS